MPTLVVKVPTILCDDPELQEKLRNKLERVRLKAQYDICDIFSTAIETNAVKAREAQDTNRRDFIREIDKLLPTTAETRYSVAKFSTKFSPC
eukprot:SAG31_NODE_885_length_11254_cov_14.613088_7_plen_92_part_00